jgi:predicted dehydrogenase
MNRIGIVDLDTSHAGYYATCINRTNDLRVTAVWDGGAVRSPDFAESFAREHNVDKVCTTLAELVAAVDAGMVLGQDWDLHVQRARPFLEAGKPVYIDKPIVGRWRDAMELMTLVKRTGTPAMGGSSLRYAKEVVELRERQGELGRILSAFASGPGDFFNYGCHIVEMARGFFGLSGEAVSFVGGDGSDLLVLEQRGGPPAVLQFSAGPNHPDNAFFFALTTERDVHVIRPKAGWEMSERLVDKFAHFVRTGKPATTLAESLETIKVCLAAAEARRIEQRVVLDNVPPNAGFDGHKFTADYASGGGYDGTGLLDARSIFVPST